MTNHCDNPHHDHSQPEHTTNPREHGLIASAITTAITQGDFKASADIVNGLDDIEVHGVIGALVGCLVGVAHVIALQTGGDPDDIVQQMVQHIGASLTFMPDPEGE